MNAVVASVSLLPEAIDVIYASLAERKKRRPGLKDVREWLVDLPPANDEGSGDAEAGGEKHCE
ncbi:hypothetical protein PI124_g16663 [Phytophthora idaei]|nr:hypothetical protein PI125_g6245 [Phytophthora idaei]KAG3168746.1 hypothetical protein PI126_g3166 [Phytophthora idaei]KAG3238378.1 hypothetical protein PI124_g16663 [Phytophthora idaei]